LTGAREAVSQALAGYGVGDQESIDFVLFLVRSHGLTAPPVPKPKTTARQIRQRAQAAVRRQLTATTDAEWVTAARERYAILSEEFQTVRGDAVIPIGPHERRRPEPELAYAMQLLDHHLEWTGGMPPMDRYCCISDLLRAACGYFVTPDTIKHRLARAAAGTGPVGGERPLQPSDYELAWWRSQQDAIRPALTTFPWRVSAKPDDGMIVDAHGMFVTRRPPSPQAGRSSARWANMRSCLQCGTPFQSAGPANQLCGRCRRRASGGIQ